MLKQDFISKIHIDKKLNSGIDRLKPIILIIIIIPPAIYCIVKAVLFEYFINLRQHQSGLILKINIPGIGIP
jgi:hypothetical protein